jgi:hypothetical protein
MGYPPVRAAAAPRSFDAKGFMTINLAGNKHRGEGFGCCQQK